ncbi:hypothetical protein F511_33459 [Dorcoceras hygrometricum]|uniref:Uncharacterized protein n=1 Tax=Dorcoceras hygrometricum TaxID=472368 RepID=A0A2Z7CHZ4_9LAMI|nr:hypothetical protein F511_33459 [Dorcoceras hygrometricum]
MFRAELVCVRFCREPCEVFGYRFTELKFSKGCDTINEESSKSIKPTNALNDKGHKAPGSDQFHEGIGPSTVERLDRRLSRSTTRISTPSPVSQENQQKFHGRNLLAEMVETNSDGGGGRRGKKVEGRNLLNSFCCFSFSL